MPTQGPNHVRFCLQLRHQLQLKIPLPEQVEQYEPMMDLHRSTCSSEETNNNQNFLTSAFKLNPAMNIFYSTKHHITQSIMLNRKACFHKANFTKQALFCSLLLFKEVINLRHIMHIHWWLNMLDLSKARLKDESLLVFGYRSFRVACIPDEVMVCMLCSIVGLGKVQPSLCLPLLNYSMFYPKEEEKNVVY